MRRVHGNDDELAAPRADHNRMLGRRSPLGETETGLSSRQYEPRLGGPQLVASWRLGAPPTQSGIAEEPWEIRTAELTRLQTTILSPPYVTDPNHGPAYLVVCGQGWVDTADDVLRVALSNSALSGKPYETEISLENTEPRPFMTPLVELTPDRPDYETKAWSNDPTKYELAAAGDGYLHPATNVQLWSE